MKINTAVIPSGMRFSELQGGIDGKQSHIGLDDFINWCICYKPEPDDECAVYTKSIRVGGSGDQVLVYQFKAKGFVTLDCSKDVGFADGFICFLSNS